MRAWDVWILEGLWLLWSFCFLGKNSLASLCHVLLPILIGFWSLHPVEVSSLQNMRGEALKGLSLAGRKVMILLSLAS